MNTIYLTLPLPPLLNRYYRKFKNVMVLSEAGATFKQEVALICRLAGITPLQGEVEVLARVYRKRNAGDTDSFLKATLDSLQGFAYENDKQVASVTFTRDKDAQHPRLEIIIRSYTDDRPTWQQLFNAGETTASDPALRNDDPRPADGGAETRTHHQKRR